MKEGWYSFFRPRWSIVALAFVLFIVFSPFIYYDNGIRCIKAPCYSENLGSVVNFFILAYSSSNVSIDYGLLIIGILVSYGLSCVIIALTTNIGCREAKKRRNKK